MRTLTVFRYLCDSRRICTCGNFRDTVTDDFRVRNSRLVKTHSYKNDPKGVAVHILENHGVLLTTFNQFETVCLSTAMSALPEELLKEPVSMAELTGDMDYVNSFEEDRREGNGGPAQPLP